MFSFFKKKSVPPAPPRHQRGIVAATSTKQMVAGFTRRRRSNQHNVGRAVPDPPPRWKKGIVHTKSSPTIQSKTAPPRKQRGFIHTKSSPAVTTYNRQGATTSNRPTANNHVARSFVHGNGNRGNDSSWVNHRENNKQNYLANGRLAESDANVMAYGGRTLDTGNGGVYESQGAVKVLGRETLNSRNNAPVVPARTVHAQLKPTRSAAPPVPSRRGAAPPVPSRHGITTTYNRQGVTTSNRPTANTYVASSYVKSSSGKSRGNDRSWMDHRKNNEQVTLANGRLAESDAKVMASSRRPNHAVNSLENSSRGKGLDRVVYEGRGQDTPSGWVQKKKKPWKRPKPVV